MGDSATIVNAVGGNQPTIVTAGTIVGAAPVLTTLTIRTIGTVVGAATVLAMPTIGTVVTIVDAVTIPTIVTIGTIVTVSAVTHSPDVRTARTHRLLPESQHLQSPLASAASLSVQLSSQTRSGSDLNRFLWKASFGRLRCSASSGST